MLLRVLLACAAGLGLAAFTYGRLEGLGRRGLVPMAARAVAWAALLLLVANASCPVPGAAGRPIVLLDASLSMSAAGGRWEEARRAAAGTGEVVPFGDERDRADTVPDRGASRLGPALAAAAGGRPVVVVTDGEIDDLPELPADLLGAVGVRLFPRAAVPDLAVTRVSGPARATAGDTVRIAVDLAALGGYVADSVAVRVADGAGRPVVRATARLQGGTGRVELSVPTAALGPGEHLLQVGVDAAAADREPRTDQRLHLLTVARTPGVVLLASPPDWDSRFLYRALVTVADLPTRGYLRVAADRWRSMADLRPVPAEEVRQAARGADLLVLKGGTEGLSTGSRARAVWRWPSGEGGETPLAGDWYAAAGGASPLAGALAGTPVESLPPLAQVAAIEPPADAWVALTAQEGRRGPPRAVVFGRQGSRGRELVVAADGLWRWAFPGGAGEQAYRGLVGTAVAWLLGAPDSAAGRARSVRPVVQQGRPLVFAWAGAGTPEPTVVRFSGAAARTDTLRFDGAGTARAWLPAGAYRYAVDGGGAGTVAVEAYSDEFLPRAVTLTERAPRATPPAGSRSVRDLLWLSALLVAALAAEWLARRRLGLR